MSGISSDPIPHPAQVAVHGNVRITVLTERLLRIEYASDATFEDRPTLSVVNRRFPETPFRVRSEGHALTVDTGAVELHCADVRRPFTGKRLQARIGTGDRATVWRHGAEDRGNLGGTVRTLDGWDGNKVARAVGFDPDAGFVREWDEQVLAPGLLSRAGWVVVDDSDSVLLAPGATRNDRALPVPRPPGERRDLYLFAHGDDHKAALRDGARLFGPQPLPPRFAFGYWYSRYYPYTDRELVQLADQLAQHDVPVDVLVIDMDWHRVGWTGYSWDRDLFPDPTETLTLLHDRGLRVSLNLHPADGVGSHEDAFAAMCEAMGLDPDATDRVPFDVTDPRFVEAYFRLLHHPEEDRGVDLWWMDWQQGTDTPVPGLDPLAWLNHLHWDDQVRRQPDRRPLIFSRWGGLGAGRHPIGFSGDTHATWESLAYQPEFTATAANVLYGYWSHDIGGHFGTVPDPELYTRWIQFGAHSPVLRTHGTLAADLERRLWEYSNPHRSVMIDAVRRRYELVPYIYGECRRGVDTGLSLVRPMYHEHPDSPAAYEAPGQYHFGDQMVVAPVTSPIVEDSMAGVRIWLPKGDWFDTAHGSRLKVESDEGEWFERRYLLSEVPVFVRAGTVLPTQSDIRRLDTPSYPNLAITAFPGADGSYDLYEDDGVSSGYEQGESTVIPLRHEVRAGQRRIVVGPAHGSYESWWPRRSVELRFVAEAPPQEVKVGETVIPRSTSRREGHWWYDTAAATAVVLPTAIDLRHETTVSITRAAEGERDHAEALLDGYPGLTRRLSLISGWTRALLGDDSRSVVRLSRAAERVTMDPSRLALDLGEVVDSLGALDLTLERSLGRWRELESLNPTDPPNATATIENAVRLLGATRAQFAL